MGRALVSLPGSLSHARSVGVTSRRAPPLTKSVVRNALPGEQLNSGSRKQKELFVQLEDSDIPIAVPYEGNDGVPAKVLGELLGRAPGCLVSVGASGKRTLLTSGAKVKPQSYGDEQGGYSREAPRIFGGLPSWDTDMQICQRQRERRGVIKNNILFLALVAAAVMSGDITIGDTTVSQTQTLWVVLVTGAVPLLDAADLVFAAAVTEQSLEQRGI